MRPLVTGQFNDSIPPIMDGVVNVALNYAYWMNRKYGKGYVVGPRVPGQDETDDFHVLRYASLPIPGMGPYRIGLPGIDPLFSKAVRDIDFDLVHAHCPFISGRLALEIARKQDIPIITTFHSKYREDFRRTIASDFIVDQIMNNILEFLEAVDYVWVPNKSTGETLREYGYTAEIEVFENGTDMRAPTEEEADQYRARGLEKAKVEEDVFTFLFVGQHRWVKNIRLILDALKLLRDRGRDFRMVFVGEGSDTREIVRLTESHKLNDHVRFMGVITNREELKTMYAAADLFLFPSTYDNAPIVLREAAAFRVPAVLVRGSTASEAVEDGVNGFLIENDTEDFVDTVERIMDDAELRRTAGLGARRTIYRSWESIVDEVHERYQQIVSS